MRKGRFATARDGRLPLQRDRHLLSAPRARTLLIPRRAFMLLPLPRARNLLPLPGAGNLLAAARCVARPRMLRVLTLPRQTAERGTGVPRSSETPTPLGSP